MSDSPQSNPKDVDQGGQSGDEEAPMNDPQDPHGSGAAYEFEVKEQDRWLPIANGTCLLLLFMSFSPQPVSVSRRGVCLHGGERDETLSWVLAKRL
jgi:hypothetical protein